jgi:glycosyltransferase involved in cell wall biosynthesis
MFGVNKRKILFITLARIDDINVSGIYTDLISKFVSEGYDATIICPIERRFGLNSRIINSNGVRIIQVKSLNIQKTNVLEKIVSTFLLEFILIKSFLKNCKNESYDIGLFTTPPIFITNFIKLLNKKRLKIRYLLLKDIFPQNALDLNIVNKFSPFYLYSRFIEKKLYNKFDFIGCMSKANMNYIIKHNTINKSRIEVNPNSVDVSKYPKKKNNKKKTKELKLVYGGNLGLPQNPILITKFISKIENLDNICFKIIGSGTEFKYIESYIIKNNISKTKILRSLTKASYFEELDNSDVGLIFLNEKFTIPNYPSRLLDYLYFDLAIISNTDSFTDIDEIIVKENLGKSFYGMRDLDKMISEIIKLRNITYLKSFNNNSQSTLLDFFNIETTFNLIDNKFKND